MTRKLLTIICLFTLTSCAAKGPGGVDFSSRSIAGLDVAVWLPPETTPKPAPVIIFSHGFTGCNTQSAYLMEAFALSGYAVFAPNHADASCQEGGPDAAQPAIPFAEPEKWSEDTYRERGQDISKLITALEHDVTYGNKARFDWQRIGLAGHSLGGYTVLGAAGAWPGWKDQRIREERIKAVLAMAPYTLPFTLENTYHYMQTAVMYQVGSVDKKVTHDISKQGGAYDKTPAPKHYVEFDGAGHSSWSGSDSGFHEDIMRYSIAFFDYYLKGTPIPAALTKPHAGVAHYRQMGD